MKILTNHPGQEQSQTWAKCTTYINIYNYSLLSLINKALTMINIRRKYDCIVLGAGRADLVYLILSTLIPLSRKRTIIIDCLWYESNNKIYKYLKKALFKILDLSVDAYVVWASREIAAYSKAFGLPLHKFKFIPYHHTINNGNIDTNYGDYIFSGGNFGRDYKTLIEAVRGIDVKLLIASTRPELFEEIEIPDNVIIKGFTHIEYLEKMANCFISVVALAPNLLHSGGQQTFLNSMYFGKPTIVLDPEGASDYIVNGQDGILVEPGNSAELRSVILYLLENKEKALEIGSMGRKKAMLHSTDDHFKMIIELAQQLVSRCG